MKSLLFFILALLPPPAQPRKNNAELEAQGQELLDVHILLDRLGAPTTRDQHGLTAAERLNHLVERGVDVGAVPTRGFRN